MFQKRHYEAIAQAMQNAYPKLGTPASVDQWEWDCLRLADMFRSDNARFDRLRFMAACRPGVDSTRAEFILPLPRDGSMDVT